MTDNPAPSQTIPEINAFLRFTQKFKMDVKIGVKMKEWKMTQCICYSKYAKSVNY